MEKVKGKLARIKPEYLYKNGIDNSLLLILNEPTNVAEDGAEPIMLVNVKFIEGDDKKMEVPTNIEFLNIIENEDEFPLYYKIKNTLHKLMGCLKWKEKL